MILASTCQRSRQQPGVSVRKDRRAGGMCLAPGERVGRVSTAWTGIAVGGALLAAAARAGEDPGASTSRALAPAAIESTSGTLFAWPALDAPEYGGADAAPFREMLERWKAGERPRGLPTAPRSAAARYLAADLTFLAMTTRRCAGFAALDAYERALRTAPDFADAARARFMVGATDLALGLFPEAAAAFARCATRHPALALEARIGQAAALRRGGRPVEARRVLDGVLAQARGETLCRARREDAALATTPVEHAAEFTALAKACPRALSSAGFAREWAEALIAAGDVETARRLLASPRPPLGDEEEGRLHLLAGTIAADPDAARLEYERVRSLHVPPALSLEADMRLALLETAHDPARRAARLGALARRDAPKALRAVLLGAAAEASAEAGRFDQALALVDRSPPGTAEADVGRGRIVGRWIGALAADGDSAGVATVYAAYTTAIETRASAEERLSIGRALGALGLHAAAVRVLRRGAREPGGAALRAALAEEALASDDLDRARAAAARVLADLPPPDVATRARAVLARAALRAGNVDAAATIAAEGSDLELRAEVARALLPRPDGAARASALLLPLPTDEDVPTDALLAAGGAALAESAWSLAAETYRRALAVAPDGPARAEAAAGLARAARGSGERAAAARALGTLADVDDGRDAALFRRVAATVAARGARRR
jgi:tetratricopeptide (TPR) repeat protein